MTRVLRVGLSACLGFGLALPFAAAAGDDSVTPGRVRLVAQKPAKKKARGKKAAADEPATATPAGADPSGDGDLKFSRDIAPIFVGNCVGCHNDKDKRGKFVLTSFEKLMQGTPDEKVIVPGKPEESHLVLRIKAQEKPKMPLGNNRNLSAEAVAKVEAWVKAGALLDAGADPKASLETFAATPADLRKAELAKLSAGDRDKQTEAVGRERWKKASPKTNPEVTSGTHFLIFTVLPKERASAALKAVEGQYGFVKSLLGPASVDWGEKASLYVFPDAASFGEFVRMNESREADAGDQATARFNVPQPYVAVLDVSGGRDDSGASKKRGRRGDDGSAGGERSLPVALVEAFASGAAVRGGQPPRWLTLGVGVMAAAKAEPRAAYVARVRRQARQIWQEGQSKAVDALSDAGRAEDSRAVGLAILEALSASDYKSRMPAFLNAIVTGGGINLDRALAEVLDASRQQFLEFVGESLGPKGE